jgi:hypothetical protein
MLLRGGGELSLEQPDAFGFGLIVIRKELTSACCHRF